MLACRGHVQREGDAIHVVAEQLDDLSDLLGSVGNRPQPFPVPHGRGDGVTHQNGPAPREVGGTMAVGQMTSGPMARNGNIRVRTTDFR
jgi:error-prone DNA polymerase